MPVKSANKWEKALSTIFTSGSDTSGSDWVSISAPTDWVTVSTPTTTTDSYIWATSTTPITAGSSTITITYPPDHEITHALDLATREHEFPLFDTYNLDSPKGREKFVEVFKEYLLASFQPHVTLRLDA